MRACMAHLRPTRMLIHVEREVERFPVYEPQVRRREESVRTELWGFCAIERGGRGGYACVCMCVHVCMCAEIHMYIMYITLHMYIPMMLDCSRTSVQQWKTVTLFFDFQPQG
jgi:hypothetical protein